MIIIVLIIIIIVLMSIGKVKRGSSAPQKKSGRLSFSIENQPEETGGLISAEFSRELPLFSRQLPYSEPANLSIGYSLRRGELGSFNRQFFSQIAGLKNIIDGKSCLTDRTMLYESIKQADPAGLNYLPNTIPLKDLHEIRAGQVKIAKLSGSFSSGGIFIITNDVELAAAKKADLADAKSGGNAVVSDYVTNVATISGRKFHVRVYMAVYYNAGIVKCYYFDKYRIYTAAKPYIRGQYDDPQIHLTCSQNTDDIYEYSANFDEIISLLTKVISPRVISFPESRAGFEILGVDVLIDEDGRQYLLEVNNKVGYGMFFGMKDKEKWMKYITQFSREYFAWLRDTIIYPHFGLSRPQPALYVGASSGRLAKYIDAVRGDFAICPFADAADDELRALAEIGELPEIYAAIGDKQPWTYEKILSLREYDRADRMADFRQYYHWAIMLGDVVVGYIGTHKYDSGNIQLRYFIGPQFAGRGFASAAVATVAEIFAAQFRKVYIVVDVTNVSSNAVAKKAGAELEGQRQLYGVMNNVYSFAASDRK